MRRREFLVGSAIAAGNAGRIWGQSPDKAKLDRIAIMSLCFDNILKSPSHPDDPKRTLDILDLPVMFAERYGVHNVEMSYFHFLSTESAYFKEFRDRMKKAKSQINQISLGQFGILSMSSPDPVLRLETIDLTKQWIDHAVELNCPRVMVNQGTLAPEVRKDAIATLKTMVDYGKTKKVFVTLENRDGGSSGRGPAAATWDLVVEAIKATGAYANPDMSSFPNEEARKAGLRVMYPMTSGSSHCHHNPRFEEADAIRIAKEVGYKGLYSIETLNDPDPYMAVQSVLDELLRDI